MKRSIIAFLLAHTFITNAQSPWVAEKGQGYAQVGFTTIGPYSDLFLSDGSSYRLTREVSDKTIQFYGEYGIGPKTSILGSVPFKLLKTGSTIVNPSPFPNTEGSISTLGNIQIATRHNFVNKNLVFSGQLLVELPTAGYDEATGLRGGLDAASFVPSISVGKGFSDFYAFASTGVAIKTNGYSSEARISAEAGYKVMNRVYIIGVLDVVENFENGNTIENLTQLQSGLYLNNQSFFAYGIKTIIGITEKIGVNAAFYGASSGNLVARSPSLNLGAYYKW